jgi:TRAP-type C4-dicarboxylate transport system permease small subunit
MQEMKPVYQRIFAILILCIPGAMGIYGFSTITKSLFAYLGGEPINWTTFIIALICFLIAFFFLGGFIFYRDKKKHRVQPKLLNEEEREQLIKAKAQGEAKKDKYAYYKKV